ncbi:MAG: ribulose bisphosphate carboxylase small subunit [Vulcanimicrobiaceae bacterium]
MHLTQGTFSYLPSLSDDEIAAQVHYCLDRSWSISIEFTDDPHPRNVYWEMWGLPMFDLRDPAGVLNDLSECRATYPNHYIKINAYDRSLGRQTTALSFIVNRPQHEPGFAVERTETEDRRIRYTLRPYAADKPHGERYGASG